MATHVETLCPSCKEALGTGIGAFFRSAAVFHLFVVVCTLGLWIPVWIWLSLKRRKLGICAEFGRYVDPSREIPDPKQPKNPVAPILSGASETDDSRPQKAA